MIRAACAAGGRAILVSLTLWGAAATALAQGEPALIKRATELRESPGDAGRNLAALPAQAQVTRLPERQGAWVRVSSGSATGWVHMFDLGPASGSASNGAAPGSTSGALRNVTSLFSSRSVSSSTNTAASGIRGLSAEDLAKASPNLPAVTQMEGLRQSEGQARQFAQTAQLAPASVPDLPVVARPSSSAQGGKAGNPEQAP